MTEPMFDKKTLVFGSFKGISVLIMVFLVYYINLKYGRSAEYSRTMAFATLVFGNLLLIITNLSWNKHALKIILSGNKILLIVLGLTTAVLTASIYAPFVRSLFYFSYISVKDFIVSFLLACVSLIWFEIYKMFNKELV